MSPISLVAVKVVVFQRAFPIQLLFLTRLTNFLSLVRAVVYSLIDFDAARSKLRKYSTEIEMLESASTWTVPTGTSEVPFLQREAEVVEQATGTLDSTKMRADILSSLKLCALETVLSIPLATATSSRIPVRAVLGHLLRPDAWLNDVVVDFSLCILATRFSDVVVVDSTSRGMICIPEMQIRSARVVVFPINFDNAHWCLICLTLDWAAGRHIASLYDPMSGTG